MTSDASPGGLRVLLVDDEALARARLRDLLADVGGDAPHARVVGEAGSAAEAIAQLAAAPCDLVLLDIAMPGADGLALAAQIRQLASPPAVVFVTAHAEHALAAFDLEAVDYLTKPVRRERLQAALQRVAQRLAARGVLGNTAAAGDGGAVAPASARTAADEAIVVGDRGRIVRMPLAEVLYFKAELKYVTLRTAVRSFLIDDALAELETRFGDRFLRVHRNALVARRAMRVLERRPSAPNLGDRDDEGAEGWAVQVAEVGEWLAVSRRQVAAVREALVAGAR